MVAAIVESRMSLCLMCASSCAITPASSSLLSIRIIPVVTATAAWLGFLPVAKALGVSFSIVYTFGRGMFALIARSLTTAYNCGASPSSTLLAPYIMSTILSLHQYVTKFITPAKISAVIAPCLPPIASPAKTSIAVSTASKIVVFK